MGQNFFTQIYALAKLLILGGFFLGCLSCSQKAHAITSVTPLPAGVRAAAFVMVNSDPIGSIFNNNGNLESLVQPLNRSLTFDDFIKKEPKLLELQSVLHDLGETKAANDLLFANLYGSLQIRETRRVAALFWGLTNQISVGVMIPLIKRTYDIDFHADVSNFANQLKARLGNIPKITEGLTQLENTPLNTETFEKAIFTDNGYLPPRSFSAEGLGDIETELRARYYESPTLDFGLRLTLRSPTANHQPEIRNLFDRELGEGCFSVKLGSLHTVKIVSEVLNFQSALFGTWRAPSKTTIPIPADSSQLLANVNDPNQIETIHRHLGSELGVDTGLELMLWKGTLTLSGSYQYNTKASDTFSGERGLDYARLSEGTQSLSQSLEWGAELSGVPLFLKKRFPLPGKLIFTFHQPLAGKNTPDASYGRLDAILLF